MIDKILSLLGETTPMEIVAWVFLSILAITVTVMIYGDVKGVIRDILFRRWLKRNRNYARFMTRKEAMEAFEREDSVNEYAVMVKNMRRR